MKLVLEKKTREIILMLQRARVNPHTKCEVMQLVQTWVSRRMWWNEEKGNRQKNGQGRGGKVWDSEFVQGKAEWGIIKDFSNEGVGKEVQTLFTDTAEWGQGDIQVKQQGISTKEIKDCEEIFALWQGTHQTCYQRGCRHRGVSMVRERLEEFRDYRHDTKTSRQGHPS